MLSLFSKEWSNAVKALAEKCVTEPEFVRIMSEYEEKELTEEDKKYLQEIRKKYKDLMGMFQIANMIWRVDSALDNDRVDLVAVSQVYHFLSDPCYLEEVFEGDSSSDEWKNRMALRDGLERLILRG